MSCRRFSLMIALVGFSLARPSAGNATVLTDPTVLDPGATISPVPNGDSGVGAKLFNRFISFDFPDGPSGVLRERVLQFSDTSSAHPYGSGLYFDFEITLSSGDVAVLSVPGYSDFEVSVKQCGISNCGGSGANGVLATSASRTLDGNWISFAFGDDLSGTAHSANLQLLTNATKFVDPFATLEDGAGNLFSVPVLTPAAVPESSTWAMLLIGFAGLGFAAFRRSRKSDIASHRFSPMGGSIVKEDVHV